MDLPNQDYISYIDGNTCINRPLSIKANKPKRSDMIINSSTWNP